MKKIAEENGATLKQSPPFMKKFNGNAERFIQTLNNAVVTANAGAIDMPKAVIHTAHVYMNIVNMLKRGTISTYENRWKLLYNKPYDFLD